MHRPTMEGFYQLPSSSPKPATSAAEPTGEGPLDVDPPLLSSDEEESAIGMAPPEPSSQNHNPIRQKNYYINKLGITFSGEDQYSVTDFLVRVEELSTSREIPTHVLFQATPELLTGRALLLYRSRKDTLYSWKDVVRLLKTEFLPIDYDERLLDEIKARTMGPNETMSTYLAVMQSLFHRLSEPIPEAKQLYYIRRNLTSFYQNALTLVDCTSIAQLSAYGKRIEQNRYFMDNFKPPPSKRNTQLLEPSLAYLTTSDSGSGLSPKSETRQAASGPPSSLQPKRNITCWNCRKVGHSSPRCPAPQTLHCYGCGKAGVTKPNCPVCQSRPLN